MLLFLELEVFKMLYLTYPIYILSRLSFNLPVFVQFSSPLRKRVSPRFPRQNQHATAIYICHWDHVDKYGILNPSPLPSSTEA